MHAKHFLITMHNYYSTAIADLENSDCYETLKRNIEEDFLMHGRVEYARWQVEKGEGTGKEHIQMLLSFKTKQHESALRTLFGHGYGHAEVVRDYVKSVEYCGKEETRVAGFWEFGQVPGGQGERVDLRPLDSMAQALHAGADLVQTVLSNPTVASRGLKMLQLVARPAKRYHITRWLHLWGPSGSGKTKVVKDCIEANPQLAEEFHWKNPYNKWFDEYLGQKCEVIDDFDHLEPAFQYKELLSLLDSKPFQVEVKGGSRQFVSHLVVIMSSAPCTSWYPRRGGDLSELLRRLHDYGEEIHVHDDDSRFYAAQCLDRECQRIFNGAENVPRDSGTEHRDRGTGTSEEGMGAIPQHALRDSSNTRATNGFSAVSTAVGTTPHPLVLGATTIAPTLSAADRLTQSLSNSLPEPIWSRAHPEPVSTSLPWLPSPFAPINAVPLRTTEPSTGGERVGTGLPDALPAQLPALWPQSQDSFFRI